MRDPQVAALFEPLHLLSGTPTWSSAVLEEIFRTASNQHGATPADVLRVVYRLLGARQSYDEVVQAFVEAIVLTASAADKRALEALDYQAIAPKTPAQAQMLLMMVAEERIGPSETLGLLRASRGTVAFPAIVERLQAQLSSPAYKQVLVREGAGEGGLYGEVFRVLRHFERSNLSSKL